MKKRSLAEAFQADLGASSAGAQGTESAESAESKEDAAACPSSRAHESGRTRQDDASDEDDYMSEAMLARLADAERPRSMTYSERQGQRRREEAELRRRAMDEADARRRAKRRMPQVGEVEARKHGLSTNVIEAAKTSTAGSGTAAALKMMQVMGYKDGAQPLMPDERWLGTHGARRHGIGHADLSQRIRHAHDEMGAPSPASFREAQSQRMALKHAEHVLHLARNTCRALDEAHGWEYSPYWLDPTALPDTHTLHQRPVVPATDDACQLLTDALSDDARRADAIAFCTLPVRRLLSMLTRHTRVYNLHIPTSAKHTCTACTAGISTTRRTPWPPSARARARWHMTMGN